METYSIDSPDEEAKLIFIAWTFSVKHFKAKIDGKPSQFFLYTWGNTNEHTGTLYCIVPTFNQCGLFQTPYKLKKKKLIVNRQTLSTTFAQF